LGLGGKAPKTVKERAQLYLGSRAGLGEAQTKIIDNGVKVCPELKLRRAPHVTLVHNFKPRAEDYKVVRAVADVSRNCNSGQFHFLYSWVEVKRGGKRGTLSP